MRALFILLMLLAGCTARAPGEQAESPANAVAERPTGHAGERGDGDERDLSGPTGESNSAAHTVSGPVTRLPAPGSISGAILYPGEAIPAMRICAIHGSGDLYGCVSTPAGTRRYRIEQLPPTSYRVIAKPRAGALHDGAFVKQVKCIRAPCPAVPMPVNVAPGEAISSVDLNGFYEARKDFPHLPDDAK